MKHVFRQGSDPSAPVMVLFHGTGGTENDLLPLAQNIAPTSSVLGIRGNVTENGMNRYFRRLAEGVFDEADLILRTQEVNDFLDLAAAEYALDRRNFVAIGYSNGANIVGSLLFHVQDAFRGAILHHPMVPLRGLQLPDLSAIPCFIGAGRNDPLCTPQETEELEELLSGAGAPVIVHWEHAGHQLTKTEVAAAAVWYKSQFIEGE
ncbi:phospholipase/carboxylesterase [Paenibacillus sp. 1_12]|uniref:alpha/beta hydrolase n=1 Tax=Paenibacillus sp. 1_12 TaxID=1566278 RepID=UPI0008E6AB32|nr:alpha/beta hydrolase [Paenibacillus sp. 1_12]SFL95439.1 phospholipase/carboxylesterase [Paenibacillus sp. 1_12]